MMGARLWINAFGSTSWLMSLMGRSMSGLRAIWLNAHGNTARARSKGTPRNTALNALSIMRSIQQPRKDSRARKSLKNGNASGKLISSKLSIRHGAIFTMISENNQPSFRKILRLPAAWDGALDSGAQNLSGIRFFGLLFLQRGKQIGFRINFLSPKGAKRKSSGMTCCCVGWRDVWR